MQRPAAYRAIPGCAQRCHRDWQSTPTGRSGKERICICFNRETGWQGRLAQGRALPGLVVNWVWSRLYRLTGGPGGLEADKTRVTIPEGYTVEQIDKLLAEKGSNGFGQFQVRNRYLGNLRAHGCFRCRLRAIFVGRLPFSRYVRFSSAFIAYADCKRNAVEL